MRLPSSWARCRSSEDARCASPSLPNPSTTIGLARASRWAARRSFTLALRLRCIVNRERSHRRAGQTKSGWVSDIRPLGPADVDASGSLLGRAFRDNPVYRGVLGHQSDEARAAGVSRVTRSLARASIRYQEAEGIWLDGRLAGASLVCAPGQYPHRLAAFLEHAAGCLTTGPRGAWNFIRLNAHFTKHHVRGPHYYLFVLGVERPTRARGSARRCCDRCRLAPTAIAFPATSRPTSRRA